jgi:uncharacterized membrane protein
MGSIYAVILAFVIFVIWNQFTEVENCIIRECSSLSDLLRFAAFAGEESSRSIRRAVENYAQQVVRFEWRELGEGRPDKHSSALFAQVINSAMSATDGGGPLHERLADLAQEAAERRAIRVSKSLTRIPPTMFWFVNLIAGTLILLLSFYPFRHWATGAICLALLATVLLIANFVMRDMDNPLTGVWNISAAPFSELKH